MNDLGGSGRGEGADLTPAHEVEKEIEANGGRAAVNGGNVADWGPAEELVNQAVDTFGGLDIVVNNAGILRDKMSFNMSEEDFDAVVDVVLKGTFAPSRFAAAYWRQKQKDTEAPVRGAIVNTSSQAGIYGNLGQANYGSAKMAVAALTITMARELERIGARVNCIAPAAATRLLATVRSPDQEAAVGDAPDPMAPSQISPLVVWLCSDLAADISGQVFTVNGGHIQLLQGWRPLTEIDVQDAHWSIEQIEAARPALIGQHPVGVPPFMPELARDV